MAQLERAAEHEAGLRHGAFGCVNEQDNAVDHLEYTLNLTAEVSVTRGVYYIYLGVAVPYGGVLGHDGDAALTLKVIGVHYAVHDLLIFAVYAGLLEHFVDQSGLAVVNVGNDCYVSEFVHLSQLPCVRFVSDFIFNTKLNFNTSETKNQHKSAIFAEISEIFTRRVRRG